MFYHYFLSLRKKKEGEISSPTTTTVLSRDFVKDPFRPVNIKSPELMSCEQEILDSHRTAELIQKRRKIKSLAISEGKMKKKNRIVAETILGRSVLKSKRNTYSSAVKKQIVGHIKTLSSENPGISLRRIVQIVRSHEGYEKVSHKMRSTWLRQFFVHLEILEQSRYIEKITDKLL